ncbi:hypothetical protein COCSADRAFT_76274 [Bipolaris sorokiniana ND90Pr]|uniref:Cytochrome P450 n=1 Tax=Cochliobolus sativus (strain ND90Pr / ATCC 201652) TaxID=665912 RepID=M2T5J2_COCSN|nr:uncharacterized protein COCSADRAFT_76274 [Bipolaris sorokiniana ND90Pr]EMD69700.1 hypothetical protein COCSADRAFT_76274 [Bipolaris sorokiniana ND90Pr]
MPKEKTHLQFKKWAEEYGPVYSLMLGTWTLIVLASDQAVKDLLDKRSAIYSSRPDHYLAQVASGGLRFALMPYGDPWRMIRKIVHNNLNITATKSYVPYQDLESKALLVELLDIPELFIDHLRRYTHSLTTQMVFGFRTPSIDDPKLKQLFWGIEKFSQVHGKTSAALLDLYPVLRSLPDAVLSERRHAKQLHEKSSELFVGLWLDVKKAIKNGTAKPCFCVDLVRAQEEENISDELAAYISGSILEAGSDTTAAELVSFTQAMILFPEVAKAAQEELDRVCGHRLPTLEDWPNLPYIHGCIKETLRWMPTVISGAPHGLIRDDEYMGYTIPKGAGVLPNSWAIHNDPKRHPDPRRFDPTRYIHDQSTAAESANNPDPTKRDHFGFGAGRRVCQGMHVAERSLFLAISRLLWAFDFRPARDEAGEEIIPDPENLTEGTLSQPKPFPASITPRNKEKVTLIREEWAKMEALLDEEQQWEILPEGLKWKDVKTVPKEA